MLQAKNIHKRYQHPSAQLHVLKGISLKIEEGDVLAVVGPSGAGKSTLLHVLGGLDRPDEGQVLFGQQDVYRLPEGQRAAFRNREVGFIFQFYHLLPEFTALENVILPGMVAGKKADDSALRAKGRELLERVGLGQRQEHRPQELSGGEQQRVAIARALLNDPTILLCDEPTGNLDSQRGKDIIDLLLDLNAKHRQTLVIVTHDERIAERTQKVIRMKDGVFL